MIFTFRKHISIFLGLLIILFIEELVFSQPYTRYEPLEGKIYHGVGWGENAQIEYSNIFPPEYKPLLYQVIIGIPGSPGRPLTVNNLINQLQPSHFDQEQQYAELSISFKETGEDHDIAHDTTFALQDIFDHYLDTLAQALTLHGRPVFLRFGGEFNGPWNGFTPWIFPLAFRKLIQGLRDRGVTELASVWCYEPDAVADFADSTEAGWKWYPGDDVVDWFGLDLFDADHFDPALPDSDRSQLTKKGRTELFLNFAQSRGKPVYLNELSARHVFITPDQNDPDSSEGKHDWEFWFEPFFTFLELHPNIKAFNYINLNWTEIDQYATWGDARIQINTYIKNRWKVKLSQSRYLHMGTDLLNPNSLSKDSDYDLPPFFSFKVSPNPFNASTIIDLFLPTESRVRIFLFDLLGRKIDCLSDQYQTAGNCRILWNPENLPSGMYIVQVKTRNIQEACKVVYLK